MGLSDLFITKSFRILRHFLNFDWRHLRLMGALCDFALLEVSRLGASLLKVILWR